MSLLKTAVPVLLAFTAFSNTSEAQLSVPLFKTTYQVQVKKEMWRNGNFYWSTEFESSDYEDAELMYELLLFALEAGEINQLLGSGFDWIIVDVRLVTKRELQYFAEPLAPTGLYFRRP